MFSIMKFHKEEVAKKTEEKKKVRYSCILAKKRL